MTRRSSAGAAALLQSSGKGRESRRDSNGAYDLGLLDQESVISFDDDDDDRSVWRWSRQGIGSIGVALLAMLIIFTMWPGIWNMHKVRSRLLLLRHALHCVLMMSFYMYIYTCTDCQGKRCSITSSSSSRS